MKSCFSFFSITTTDFLANKDFKMLMMFLCDSCSISDSESIGQPVEFACIGKARMDETG